MNDDVFLSYLQQTAVIGIYLIKQLSGKQINSIYKHLVTFFGAISKCLFPGVEVGRLKNRVHTLESATGIASPLTDNSIYLGPGGGIGARSGQRRAALQSTVQQLLRDELQSNDMRGVETKHQDLTHTHTHTPTHTHQTKHF